MPNGGLTSLAGNVDPQHRVAVAQQIDPGVPATATIGAEPLALALKSGNFGAVDFFAKALRQLDGGAQ